MQNFTLYKNRSIVALAICLFISLGLMFMNVRFTSISIRSVFSFFTYPITYSVSAVGGFFANSLTGIVKIQSLEKELETTRQRLDGLQEQLLQYQQITKDNDDLRSAIQIKPRINQTSRYARIVFRDPNLTGDYYIIDKGYLDGIKKNMPVVSYDENGAVFLVGKTTEVNLSATKIQLLSAADSYIGVTLKLSGYVGILRGHGSWNQDCIVDYIPIEARAQAGEEVITSGESDIYPPGLLIGKIVGIGESRSEEFFKKLYVKPEFKYSRLRDVFVIEWSPGVEVKKLIENAGGQ